MLRTQRRYGTGTRAVLAGLLGAASVMTAVGAGPASAASATTNGSIVYLKGGYVWVAHPDGSHPQQFTTNKFNWASPSEADNGTIVVAGGRERVNPDGSDSDGSSELYRFSPDGNQIGGAIPTWGSYSTPSCPSYPPTSVQVSPDASKIAYGILGCGDSYYTALWTPATATGLDFPGQDLGQQDFYDPSWVDSSRFVVSHAGPTVTDTQARWFIHNVSEGDDVGKGWVDPDMTGTDAQGLISRNGDELVVFENDAANWTDGKPRSVNLWLFTGVNVPNNWTLRCKVALNASQTTQVYQMNPSVSPDGQDVIWGDDRGVEKASLADPSNCASISPQLLVPGAAQPFFSAGTEHAMAKHPHQPGALHPHAKFLVNTSHARVHHKVTFDASSSHEASGHIASYDWKFGDGHKATGRKVKHAYAKAKTYIVTLTVRDRAGTKNTIKRSLKVWKK